MTLDKVENGEYNLQNTLDSPSDSLVKISLKKRYYVDIDMFNLCCIYFKRAISTGPNNEFMRLTNETEPSMKTGEWYLLPYAYKITLTP